jgi:hypothetical protein
MKLSRLTLALILLAGCATHRQPATVTTLPPAPPVVTNPLLPPGFVPGTHAPTITIMSRAEPASVIQPSNPGFVFLPCSVSVQWNPSVPNFETGETNIATHYDIYIGDCPRHYSQQIPLGNVTNGVVTNLTATATYYFAITALDDFGVESDFSDELRYTVPPKFAELHLDPPGDKLLASPDLFTWSDRDGTLSNGVWTIRVSPAPIEFYRSLTLSTQTNLP